MGILRPVHPGSRRDGSEMKLFPVLLKKGKPCDAERKLGANRIRFVA
jgi:hypothetical protein